MRREADHARPYLVDRVPGSFLVAAILLLMLTLVDGVVTIFLLDHGYEEANPIMAYLLTRGHASFLIGKYLLTAVFLPVALVMNQYRLFGSRVRVGHLLPVAMMLYFALIVYQGFLWSRREAASAPPGAWVASGNPRQTHAIPGRILPP